MRVREELGRAWGSSLGWLALREQGWLVKAQQCGDALWGWLVFPLEG